MKRLRFPTAVVLLALSLATAALAAMGLLTVNTKSFDNRTFEYGGHVSYQYETPMGADVIHILTHNNNNCQSGQCGIEPHYLWKCRITAGNQDHFHFLAAKILKNDQVEIGPESKMCTHADGGWNYRVGWFAPDTAGKLTGDVFKYRVTISNSADVPQDSNDVIL